jgi:hypothetical protein
MAVIQTDSLNLDPNLQNVGAVSWAAVFAGAAAAAALSLILLILGLGLGLSSVSPWAQSGVTAIKFGISTIVWLGLTQVLASGMGGYLAGRLRTRWVGVATDEVYFRDTAHGFLAWAVASLLTASLLTSSIASIVSSGASATASIAGGAVQTAMGGAVNSLSASRVSTNTVEHGEDAANPLMGMLEGMMRKTTPALGGAGSNTNSSATPSNLAGPASTVSVFPEISRIFLTSFNASALSPADLTYVGQLVAQRTDLSQQESEKRVSETFTTAQARLLEAKNVAKETADKARKASATAALWLFVSLLIGAFSASLFAIYGGRRRDLELANPRNGV